MQSIRADSAPSADKPNALEFAFLMNFFAIF